MNQTNDTLSHKGVPGMRWGERRYQNPDGSLTPLGRIHYGVGRATTPTISKKDNKTPAEVASSNVGTIANETGKMVDVAQRRIGKRPDYSKMSNQEIQEKVNRMRLESEYARLTSADTNAGFELVKDVLSVVGSLAAITASAATVYRVMKKNG